eukprot:Lithocolla_globosa_v1_NODE_9_length_11346_cov_34.130712.p7 type:complete len:110 gc:universal NODE_9_length_11346_cov_34.130712:583-912(+)
MCLQTYSRTMFMNGGPTLTAREHCFRPAFPTEPVKLAILHAFLVGCPLVVLWQLICWTTTTLFLASFCFFLMVKIVTSRKEEWVCIIVSITAGSRSGLFTNRVTQILPQ